MFSRKSQADATHLICGVIPGIEGRTSEIDAALLILDYFIKVICVGLILKLCHIFI